MILDPDYARVFTQARIIAWQYGYSCSLHGSYTRDLDLILTPWTEQAHGNFEQMVRLIASACPDLLREPEDVPYGEMKFTTKPHGRLAYSLHFKAFGDRRWIDISCMPCVSKGSAAGNAEYDSWRIVPDVPYLQPDWIAAEDAAGGVLAAGALVVLAKESS